MMSSGQPAGTQIAPSRSCLSHLGGRNITGCPARAGIKMPPVSRSAQPKPGVLPGHVVGVHHGRSCDRVRQPCRQCGLPAGAASVHRQHDWAAGGAPGLAELHQAGDDGSGPLSTPRSGFGFIRGKLQPHSGQSYPCRPNRSRPPGHSRRFGTGPLRRRSFRPGIVVATDGLTGARTGAPTTPGPGRLLLPSGALPDRRGRAARPTA